MPTAPKADAETARQMISDLNDDAWNQLLEMFPDAKRPDVEQIRVVSASEWAEVISQCVEEEGFPASVRADGGISFGSIPDGQAEAQNLAMYTCRVKYPVDPSYNLPLTEGEASFLYGYYRDTLVPCLSAHGYELEVPSESVFDDKIKTGGGLWSPYQDLANISSEAFQAIDAACPQVPPGFRGAP